MKKNTTIVATGSMRLKDLRLTVELLVDAVENEHGARERLAEKYGVQKSVLTDTVRRMEGFFQVPLFTGPQRKTPSAAGQKMARYGPRFLDEIEHFSEILRDADEDERLFAQ